MHGAPLPKLVPAAVRRADQYAQMDALLVEDNSQRSIHPRHGRGAGDDYQIAKESGYSPASVARPAPKKTLKKRWEALEISKIGSFVNSKKRKIWLWLVVGRVKQRIVG